MQQEEAQRQADMEAAARNLDTMRDLARGYRMVWHELEQRPVDIERIKDLLDQHYIGGRGCLAKACEQRGSYG